MGVTRHIHDVHGIELGAHTSFVGGTLTVGREQAEACFDDPALASVRLSVVAPGDSARIVKVLDSVEPRTKGPGGGGIFPGFVGPDEPQGNGTTGVLRGAAVVVAGYLPRAQEAVVDMSGPAADLSPLAKTHNLVVEFDKADSATWEAIDSALRIGSLRLAAEIADVALHRKPDSVEAPADHHAHNGLPRVGVLTNLQTQGTFKDVFFYGRSFGNETPRLIDSGELDDGAVVSGQFGHPSLKNPTYVHQNNPIVKALRARHGVDLYLAGVVISPEPVAMAGKEEVSAVAARVCADAGFDAVIVTKEGGGNADADMALKMDALEDLGIDAVGLFAEMSGTDGTGPPIVVPPEKAIAMVSTGNYDHRLTLPAVQRAFGGAEVALVGKPATDELELPTAVVYCALSCLGWGRLRALP